MQYISRNICFLFHSVHCSIEIYWFVASYKYFIFHATCFKQLVSLVCTAPIISGTYFHCVISFTSSPFGVSSLFRHMQRTLCPNPWIVHYACSFFLLWTWWSIGKFFKVTLCYIHHWWILLAMLNRYPDTDFTRIF